MRDEKRRRNESGSQIVSPPSRSIPRGSGEGVRTSSDDGNTKTFGIRWRSAKDWRKWK
ncbi:MAG: hypothetical protein ABDI07_07205 [Candidatus Kryptonium sp.]